MVKLVALGFPNRSKRRECVKNRELKTLDSTGLVPRGLNYLRKPLPGGFGQAEVVLAVVDFPEFNNSPTGRLMASIIGAANEFQPELFTKNLLN